MPERPAADDPSGPERNPLGLGPRARESANTGSVADTSYDAYGADPYTTDEPPGDAAGPDTPADPDAPSSDER